MSLPISYTIIKSKKEESKKLDTGEKSESEGMRLLRNRMGVS
jgi:hypothetical protein